MMIILLLAVRLKMRTPLVLDRRRSAVAPIVLPLLHFLLELELLEAGEPFRQYSQFKQAGRLRVLQGGIDEAHACFR